MCIRDRYQRRVHGEEFRGQHPLFRLCLSLHRIFKLNARQQIAQVFKSRRRIPFRERQLCLDLITFGASLGPLSSRIILSIGQSSLASLVAGCSLDMLGESSISLCVTSASSNNFLFGSINTLFTGSSKALSISSLMKSSYGKVVPIYTSSPSVLIDDRDESSNPSGQTIAPSVFCS
eukprot:TRINITY_DN441_c0_g2_i2.p2 TRINITY_DN441_c0_g2~~TRINITY_DN441_c0_g2_i2.p2  ORF type:complete len:204 (-),score=43.40 TRINITY_DN441_c0_g2_i2:562-1092(-)